MLITKPNRFRLQIKSYLWNAKILLQMSAIAFGPEMGLVGPRGGKIHILFVLFSKLLKPKPKLILKKKIKFLVYRTI